MCFLFLDLVFMVAMNRSRINCKEGADAEELTGLSFYTCCYFYDSIEGMCSVMKCRRSIKEGFSETALHAVCMADTKPECRLTFRVAEFC